MNILLTGAAGQLGSELLPLLSARGSVTATDRSKPAVLAKNWMELDISSGSNLESLLNRVQPELIVNAAAYTAVDQAEADAEMAFNVNAELPLMLASWAKKNGYNVKYNAVAGCPMVLGDFSLHQTIFDQQYSKFCEQSLSLLKRNIIDDPLVEIVMIAQRYDLFYDGIGYLSNTRIMTFKDREGRVVEDHISYYKDRLSETVNSMEEEGKKVIILNQVPININVDSCSWEPLLFKFFNRNSHCEYDYGFISKKQQPSIDFVKKFCQEHELTMFDPAQAMAEPQLNGKNLYRDGDHLSEYGVYNLVPYFERYMDQIMESEL